MDNFRMRFVEFVEFNSINPIDSINSKNSKNGLTLIELLVAIGIATILAGVVVFMLKSSLDAYSFGQEEALLQKALDECLEEISSGGFATYGIKDSLEVLSAGSTFITFVPLWVDDSHIPRPEHQHSELVRKNPFILNRPFKPGAALPIGEVRLLDKKAYRPVSITFILSPRKEPQKSDDEVIFNHPIPAGSKIRFVYQPEPTYFPDVAMTIKWGPTQNRILRLYNNISWVIPKYNIPGILLKDLEFKYFDNTNTEILPERPGGAIPFELLPAITAVRLSLKAQTKAKTKEGFTFVNIRNTRTAGVGIIIRGNTRFKIPDSKGIRTFSLANIMGLKGGGVIEIEARPKKGTTWRIRLNLGFENDQHVIERYSIDYPPGRTVYSERINLTTDLPLNFLTLGRNGRYDYDWDKDVSNVVELKGDVELVVTRMDCAGAALFIRP